MAARLCPLEVPTLTGVTVQDRDSSSFWLRSKCHFLSQNTTGLRQLWPFRNHLGWQTQFPLVQGHPKAVAPSPAWLTGQATCGSQRRWGGPVPFLTSPDAEKQHLPSSLRAVVRTLGSVILSEVSYNLCVWAAPSFSSDSQSQGLLLCGITQASLRNQLSGEAWGEEATPGVRSSHSREVASGCEKHSGCSKAGRSFHFPCQHSSRPSHTPDPHRGPGGHGQSTGVSSLRGRSLSTVPFLQLQDHYRGVGGSVHSVGKGCRSLLFSK